MEAIHCSSTFLPLSSFFNNNQTQPKRQLLLLRRQRRSLLSQSSLRTQALNDAISIAGSSDVRGADISVFIPVSAALLFIYWVANFVVPNMILKDLQTQASSEEETPEVKAERSENQNANISSKSQQKIKKRHTKKITL